MDLFIDRVDPLEIALLSMAIAAGLISWRNLGQAILDRAATHEGHVDDAVVMWANHTIWSEAIRLFGAVLLAIIGLIVLTLPPFAPTPEIGWLARMVDLCATGLAALSLVESIHNGETRRLLRESLGRQIAAEKAETVGVAPANARVMQGPH